MKKAVLIIVLALFSVSSAMTDEDRDREAKKAVISANTLMPSYFQTFNVQVDEKNDMNFWFVPSNLDVLSTCMSGILGEYHSACLTQPDLGDLNVYLGSKEDPLYSMHCTKAESNAIWLTLSDVNEAALSNLISKMVTNAIDLKPMFKRSYAGPSGTWAGPGQGGDQSVNMLNDNEGRISTPLGIGY